MVETDIKVLTMGAAVQDVFLMGKALQAKRDVKTHNYIEQFPLGAKIEIDDVHMDVGGGATNAAVTFARQGFKVGFVGKIGRDPAGSEVLRVLHREGVGTEHVVYDPKLSTSFSTLLVAPSGERTILNYRGASHNMQAKDFAIKNLQADWIYISSLAGNFKLLSAVIKHAHTIGIKVALNPGGRELAAGGKLRKLLPYVEVLAANREEMAQLFGAQDPREIMAKSFGLCPYIVMTDGPNGVYATDSLRIYHAGQYQKVRVVDRSGSGDAFCSGFVAALAKSGRIEDAITLGSANATGVVQKIGAKAGILKTDRIKSMKVKAISI